MDKERLEDIWADMLSGNIDILVSTTIIETGVDIPNANTLIVEHAQRLGLSQLHQIRGRVGRSSRRAYAYFTFPKDKTVSEIATKRLEAIREYAEFGAGFKIALCDLEIRGAGNLLGAEQHGYIDSVGYDLYVKLLSEAVLEAKGEEDPAKKKTEAHIDIQTSAYIPESYISSGAQRMEMYKKISLILTEEDEGDVLDELIDRYGDPPRSVQRLTSVALTKALCERAGIERVSATDTGLTFIVGKPDLAAWSEVFAKFPGMRFGPSGDRVIYRFTDPKKTDAALLAAEIMRAYSVGNEK
jgi:transcription-repair coupling factor (superfamily II helicase)